MTAENHARSERPPRRKRWRSWLGLGLLGTALTFVGLTLGMGDQPEIKLFWTVEGISEADVRHRAEIRKLVSGAGLGRWKSFPGLALIYLDGSLMSEEGLANLKGATSLQLFSLAGVPMTGAGLNHLKAIPKLNQLDITGCGLTFEEIDGFVVARPGVKLQ